MRKITKIQEKTKVRKAVPILIEQMEKEVKSSEKEEKKEEFGQHLVPLDRKRPPKITMQTLFNKQSELRETKNSAPTTPAHRKQNSSTSTSRMRNFLQRPSIITTDLPGFISF